MFDVNVWGVAAAMKHEVVAMLRSGGGAIVSTSSITGHVGIADFRLYNASKHGVEGLTKTAALELLHMQRERAGRNTEPGCGTGEALRSFRMIK